MTKTKIKTPKLSTSDRTKLIDRPELLVVVPHTHAASVRYGADTKWCTSVPSGDGPKYFNNYLTGGNFLVYIIYYHTVENKRDKVKSKLALIVSRSGKIVDGYSKEDEHITKTILIELILSDEIVSVIKQHQTKKYEQYSRGLSVGDEVIIDSTLEETVNIPVTYMSRTQMWDNWGNKYYTTNVKRTKTYKINSTDIGKCFVKSIGIKKMRLEVRELNIKGIGKPGKNIIQSKFRNHKLLISVNSQAILKYENNQTHRSRQGKTN